MATTAENQIRSPQAAPESPTDLDGRSWRGALLRTVKGVKEDNLTDHAASLTYYAVLAMFPAVIAAVSVVGFLGTSATHTLTTNIATLVPGTARTVLDNAIHGLQGSSGVSIVFAIGLLAAIWSASGYVAAFMRAANAIYGAEEERSFLKQLPVRVGVTVALLALLVISSFAVVVTGSLARQVGNMIGVGSTAVSVWDIAKWPVLLLIVSFMFSLLYWAAPDVRHPGFRWVSPGGVLAVLLWVAASGLFAVYVAGFSSYNKTYGALAGVIVFLVWLWISNLAVLLGARLNAELERERVPELPAESRAREA